VDPEVPDRMVTFITRDSANMDRLLESDRWEVINEQLSRFIENFEFKFVPYRTGFQI
jgi:hypothetical protein